MLLSAFLVACAGSYFVYRLVARQIGNRPASQTATVVVAARDLEIGTLLKTADVTTREVVGAPPSDEISKIESVIGRGVVSPIYSGEPVNDKRLARVGSGAGLAATIPPGMRACAVKVDEVIGVAGFAVPGMRVDVLISGNAGSGSNPGTARVRTLLQNIEVLSAGKNFQKDDEGKPAEVTVVNLLVTPGQAELLSLASTNQTHMQLVLRNPIDRDIATTQGSEMATLFGAPEAPATPPAPARVVRRPAPAPTPAAVEKPVAPPVPVVIQVSNGSKRSEQKFESTGTPQ
jgi:pilus assembly protein CpaB